MTIRVSHATQSSVPDEGVTGEIGPSEWNQDHTVSGTLDAAQFPALTGDVTTTAGAVATTLATVNSNVGTFGSATAVSQVTVNAKGLVTAAADVTITPAASSVTGAGNLTKVDDTNVTLTLGGTPTGALLKATLITVGWSGTLAAARLNANVVQSVVNDTNVTGSITAQAMTLGWTGTLALSRMAQGTDGQLIVGQTSASPLYKSITGDWTLSAAGDATLATVNSNVGTFGSATKASVVTVNGKGLVTAASESTVTPAVGSITGLGTGVATWLATPSSANLASAITDETGSGALVFGTSPTFTTDLTTPLTIGGTAAGSTLTLKSTSGTGSSDAIIFQVGSNGATEGARVVTGGQFVLGSTSSQNATTGVTAKLQVHSTTTVTTYHSGQWSNNANGTGISLTKSRGAVGTHTIVQNADQIGSIFFRGSDGASFQPIAQILAEVDATPGVNDMPGRLVFLTTPDGSITATEAFRISNTQQINVATTTDATTATTGSVITAGGIGVAKAIFAGTSIKSVGPTSGIGYATGAGGTVTQATDKTTGATLNKVCGAVTMNGAALAAATIVSFTLTNSAIAATDVMVLNHISGGTVGSYTLNAQCGAGSAVINVRNNTAGSLSEAIVIQFVVIKGVNA